MRAQRARDGERGVVIVFVALVLGVVFFAAAFAVDISRQVNERQQLHDTLDAAAHAGAFELPAAGATAATSVESAIRASAATNDPTLDVAGLGIRYYCVVASERSGSSWQPAAYTIPAVCNPGAALTGMVCTAEMCAIPCDLRAGHRCNTVKVEADKTVDYQFGPAIGFDEGSTGSLGAVACKGPCARLQGSPLDIGIVVDRTASMIQPRECIRYFLFIFCVEWSPEVNHITYVRDALNGVGTSKGVFDLLLPDRHRVSLATIHKSRAVNDCRSAENAGTGTWIPVALTSSFGVGSNIRNVVACLPENESSFAGLQTDFQGPLDASAVSLRGASAHPTGLPPRRAIIFMTDGAPNLPGSKPCSEAIAAANRAKAGDDILVITIAYRLTASDRCGAGDMGGAETTDLLAAMASSNEAVAAAAAVNHCKSGNYAAENADGDFFFCSPEPADLLPIFQAALAAITDDITLLRLPI